MRIFLGKCHYSSGSIEVTLNKVKFQKVLTSPKQWLWLCDWDKEESLKFANDNNISTRDDTRYPNGVFIQSKWRVKKYEKIQEGMICGVRSIDITGSCDVEFGWEFGEKKRVYLVAINMTGFFRVPEEFIISE